ncbi:MAG: alanine:cation symporter family protein [Oscillospiraceae bacterium]|nr:alanine:cation symporter family protein [Oscillospiraceae bacterium]
MWNQFLAALERCNSFLNNIVWGWPVIILILGTGLLLTVRTGFLQITRFRESLNSTIVPAVRSLGKQQKKDNRVKSVSQFEAFSTAISGTVGTGNIIGVVSAILTGGPGAVFWMWISAFFGMVTNYSENILGLYFRKKDSRGNLSGGAFYYIANGMKQKWLGYCAAVFCIFAAVGMSGVQTNKISGTLTTLITQFSKFPSEAEHNSVGLRLGIGIAVAVITAVIILGGIKRIGKTASGLVPLMSLMFILMSLAAIVMNFRAVPRAFGMIFTGAFNFRAAGGGVLGYSFATVIRKGMARGVFSNEAGLGSSVIAHSASETREPVMQGLWGIFEVFFDTFIICTLTALTFLTTYDPATLSADMEDTAMSMGMFRSNFGDFGVTLFSVILPLFAFTTILAWSYYGEKAVEFCFRKLPENKRVIPVRIFKVVYLVLIACSAGIHSELIWAIDDTFNGLMAVPNLICLVALSGLVVKITKNYFARRRGEQVEPMLSAYPEMNEEFKADLMEQ